MLYIDDKATSRFGQLVHCLGGVVTLAAAVAIYVVFYAPTMQATAQAHLRIAELQHTLQRAPRIQREHAKLSQQLQEMETRLERVRRRVPQEAAESEFLSELTTLAEEMGMVITNLNPSAPQEKSGYWQMEVSVTGLASYESLCRFVATLRDFPRLTKVIGLDVRHDPTAQGVYPVMVTVAVFYDLVIEPDDAVDPDEKE